MEGRLRVIHVVTGTSRQVSSSLNSEYPAASQRTAAVVAVASVSDFRCRPWCSSTSGSHSLACNRPDERCLCVQKSEPLISQLGSFTSGRSRQVRPTSIRTYRGIAADASDGPTALISLCPCVSNVACQSPVQWCRGGRHLNQNTFCFDVSIDAAPTSVMELFHRDAKVASDNASNREKCHAIHPCYRCSCGHGQCGHVECGVCAKKEH
jgi:hypothetical protein